MNLNWDKFRRQQRVRKNGSEKLPGVVEPLSGPNARGYGTGPRKPAIQCPFCDGLIADSQFKAHKDLCQEDWKSRIACPAWIRSQPVLLRWRDLLCDEHLGEVPRFRLMVMAIIELQADKSSQQAPPADREVMVRRYLGTLPPSQVHIASELGELYEACLAGLTSDEQADAGLMRTTRERLVRLFETLTSSWHRCAIDRAPLWLGTINSAKHGSEAGRARMKSGCRLPGLLPTGKLVAPVP